MEAQETASEGTRVAVLSGIRLYRDSLSLLLPDLVGGPVVTARADAAELAAELPGLRADVVLVDADAAGPDALGRLAAAAPESALVVLGVGPAEAELLAYVEAGACGYVTRDDTLEDLGAVVRSAARGEAVCSPRVARALMGRVRTLSRERGGAAAQAVLTPREIEIVALIDEGLSNKEIAQRLHIGVPTVKNHVHHLLDKLGVRRRSEAAARVRALRRTAVIRS